MNIISLSNLEVVTVLQERITSQLIKVVYQKVNGLTLTLYLTSINKSIGALLEQKVEGVEQPTYLFK